VKNITKLLDSTELSELEPHSKVSGQADSDQKYQLIVKSSKMLAKLDTGTGPYRHISLLYSPYLLVKQIKIADLM